QFVLQYLDKISNAQPDLFRAMEPVVLEAAVDADVEVREPALAALARMNDGGRHTPHMAALPGASLRGDTGHRRWRLPMTLRAIVGCSAAVLAAALVALLWVLLVQHDKEPRPEVVTSDAPAHDIPAPSTEQAQVTAESVQTAMTECDQEAAKDPFSLHFLVIPIIATGGSPRSAELAGEDYGSFYLAPSKSMLDGLRNKTLTINTTSHRFAIIDSATGKMQIWTAASGVSKFTHSDTLAFSKFRIGFDVPDKGLQWSNEYLRRAGVCYWVNADFRWR
ncbi:MAG: hypothetical protein HY269_07860, partial [Deltaproteobacteria bacterium]|nr:hypothetical protein [Deltaproteobacteria bacterium]